jgi:hypothetical protein
MTHHPSETTEPETLPVICPSCLTPNSANQHFCQKCGTPLTSHAEIDPMGQIFAQGDVFRKAIDNPRRPIVIVGMWLICGPNAIFLTSLTVWTLTRPFVERFKGIQDVLTFLFSLAASGCGALIFDLMLYRLTRNFIWRRKQRKKISPMNTTAGEI